MKNSPTLAGIVCLATSLVLTACGGGGGGSGSKPASSTPALSSAPALSSTPSSSSLSASSTATLAQCAVDGKQWNICSTDNGGWGFENNQYCVSQTFCPTNRTALPVAVLRSAPVDPDANAKTRDIYTYLKSIWGQKILSGQQDLTWKDSIDMAERVHNNTGKYPALMGYDFMNYGMTANWVEGVKQTQEAIDYAKKGGLVTFSWHWRDPALLNTPRANEANFYAREADATKNTNFQIPVKNGQLDAGSEAFAQINAGIDLIAIELKKLNDAGVSVLWRPLHEASGHNGDGWFWWGRTRTDGVPQSFAQILLWRHMYDRLTNHHGVHNLLWIWNGQNAAWYPGDAYVDIVSHDIYDSTDNKTYKSQISTYTQARKYPFENKMVALSENSYIPDPDKIATDGAWWLWFMTWNDGYTAEGEGFTHKDNYWTGEYYNTNAHKTKVYGHDNVITLDELPSF
ncbi:MAG TPA: glycosyl hydrolase [Cellvibrio sp.]|nr:glycosyl hydrolase [Cellvibrio sp.]